MVFGNIKSHHISNKEKFGIQNFWTRPDQK
jgi:hypothetical protein